MSRIEIHLTAMVFKDSQVLKEDYKIVCFVKDWDDMDEINIVAGKAFSEHMDNSKELCIGGSGDIFANKKKVGSGIFQNPKVSKELLNQAADLFGLHEGTIH
tara:strand:+ start:297 stop:602 length:306 start_codon:yes stop_codon:yes gene_type:complete